MEMEDNSEEDPDYTEKQDDEEHIEKEEKKKKSRPKVRNSRFCLDLKPFNLRNRWTVKLKYFCTDIIFFSWLFFKFRHLKNTYQNWD